ncbi:hypothetical protein TSAR_004018 [Trichomalopsis sarcophagae]|uniref:Uncharacterized protein n=1 Tax=Trichomalopsis sarcophagae TaxID=543379 RepID=A0A232EY31_9HYME|nr:hypothetical protein TSAR_004018 [Trichomalopsis sarcophagae]
MRQRPKRKNKISAGYVRNVVCAINIRQRRHGHLSRRARARA